MSELPLYSVRSLSFGLAELQHSRGGVQRGHFGVANGIVEGKSLSLIRGSSLSLFSSVSPVRTAQRTCTGVPHV